MTEKNTLEKLEEKMRKEGSLSRKVGMLLKYIGVPQGISGYDYIKESVLLGLSDHAYLHNIVNGLYSIIAQKHNSTYSKVERSIRHAVHICMANIDKDDEYVYIFGNPKNKMSNSNFISAVVHFIEDLD